MTGKEKSPLQSALVDIEHLYPSPPYYETEHEEAAEEVIAFLHEHLPPGAALDGLLRQLDHAPTPQARRLLLQGFLHGWVDSLDATPRSSPPPQDAA
jgi:hypothetical protein